MISWPQFTTQAIHVKFKTTGELTLCGACEEKCAEPSPWKMTALKNVVSQKASLAGAGGRQQWRSHPMVLLGAVVGVPWESFSL